LELPLQHASSNCVELGEQGWVAGVRRGDEGNRERGIGANWAGLMGARQVLMRHVFSQNLKLSVQMLAANIAEMVSETIDACSIIT
jgi:hypothetical protein